MGAGRKCLMAGNWPGSDQGISVMAISAKAGLCVSIKLGPQQCVS